jgi:diamine N-acetyltransferase
MISCIIRRASHRDLATLQELMFKLHDEHYQAEPQHFKPAQEVMEEKNIAHYINDPDGLVFVAAVDDQIIGFVTGHFCELISSVSQKVLMGSVDELYVESTFRQQGIGKQLLERTFKELEQYGVKQIFVEVWGCNQNAIELYQNMGFQHHIHWLRKDVEKGD